MQSLLLFSADKRSFAVEAPEGIFRFVTGFGEIRYNTSVGTPIEADNADGDDFTMVELSPERDAISISGTTDAALNAALILQRDLEIPLRIFDLDYSFDLSLQEFTNVEQLRAAIDVEPPWQSGPGCERVVEKPRGLAFVSAFGDRFRVVPKCMAGKVVIAPPIWFDIVRQQQ